MVAVGRRGALGPSRKKAGGTVLRAFFAALLLVAAALSVLAVHLTARIGAVHHPPASGHVGASPGQRAGTIAKRRKASANEVDAKLAATEAEVKAMRAEIASLKSKLAEAQSHAKAAPSAPLAAGNAKADIKAVNAKVDTKDITVTNPKNPQTYPNGPKTDAKYAHDRVYCMVPFVWNEEMYDVIMRTWGKRCNVIQFLTDAEVLVGGSMQGDKVFEGKEGGGYKHHSELPAGTFPDNVAFVNMSRPWRGCTDGKTGEAKVCRHIWEKMWRSWMYVGEHHLHDAEWFCKVDYDTYFFPENLQYFVRDYKQWDPIGEHHYFGHKLYKDDRHDRPPFAVGATWCWSQRTLEGMVEVYRNMPKGGTGGERNKCEDRAKASEELGTAICVKTGLNVTVEPMEDDEMRQYVMVDPVHNVLTWNRTEQGEWWYWHNKPKNFGQMDDCCSVRPMGLHKYKRKEEIDELDQQFYGPAGNKGLKKLENNKRLAPMQRYVKKVRKAMGFDQ